MRVSDTSWRCDCLYQFVVNGGYRAVKRNLLRSKTVNRPLILTSRNLTLDIPRIPESIVQSVWPSTPKLHFIRDDSVSSPKVRQWYINTLVITLPFLPFIQSCCTRDVESVFDVVYFLFQLLSRRDGGRLRASPSANSAS